VVERDAIGDLTHRRENILGTDSHGVSGRGVSLSIDLPGSPVQGTARIDRLEWGPYYQSVILRRFLRGEEM
jgi:hypothetical protein